MKNTTKINLTALTLSAVLIQGCAGEIARVTTEEVVRAVAVDVIADKIRTNFSEDDFGLIDDSLIGKKSIYVSVKLHEKRRGHKFYHMISESNSHSVCTEFTENNRSLKTQYNCYVVAESGSKKQRENIRYGVPKVDGVLLEVGGAEYVGLFVGNEYSLTYTNLSTNKVTKFTSPGLFKQSQVLEYSAEYLARLAQKANEPKL
ncbi:MAG: hypothetical protein Rsou_0343 [Candidatus Ruthia sp. Asou_11_S2]|nr:hypothetical protein [Candidatus Ruthia sp. Asou_11_S2]